LHSAASNPNAANNIPTATGSTILDTLYEFPIMVLTCGNNEDIEQCESVPTAAYPTAEGMVPARVRANRETKPDGSPGGVPVPANGSNPTARQRFTVRRQASRPAADGAPTAMRGTPGPPCR
jgi:hypothetical protein